MMETIIYTRESRIKDVVALPGGKDILYSHGYHLGDGFVDILSQYQSLNEANRDGRLHDIEKLLQTLNQTREN